MLLVAATAAWSEPAPGLVQDPAVVPADQGQPGAQGPLFDGDEKLRLTISTDLRAVVRDRDSIRAEWHPATLAYVSPEGSAVSLDVGLKTRGHWRLDPDHCDFPPLRVEFPTRQPETSAFAGQTRLKLTTPCRSRSDRYEQYVLREYLVYRLYNILTPRSFRARLAVVTFVDTSGRMDTLTTHAFFLEDPDHLAARLGLRPMEVERAQFGDLEFDNAGLVSAFQYLIGGTDWSVWGLHNIRLMQDPARGDVYVVPYDFDWSGLVNAEYAKPDERLGLRTVRDRLYRGQCRTVEEWQPLLDRFRATRESMVALYGELPGLDERYVRDTRRYLDAFFQVIDEPRSLTRELIDPCRRRT